MKILKVTVVSLFILLATPHVVGNEIKTVYLVRHAEKLNDGSKNPDLTSAGRLRAQNLASLLKSENISAIYSTNYKRTLETAKPLAQLLGIDIRLYDPRRLEEFARMISASSDNALIVGHSNTTPALVILLGGKGYGEIRESEYDRLYQLTFGNDKVESLLLKLP